MALHKGLTDSQKRGLFTLLTGVDAQTTVVTSADPRLPEVVRPIGAETTRDTGAPFTRLFESGINTNVLGITAGVLILIVIFGVVRRAF